MFRPDRIGTPIIHTQDGTSNTSLWTPNTFANTASGGQGNVINAVPVTDFGRTALSWTAAARTVPANTRFGLLQQITITAPLNGDVRGLELNTSIMFNGLKAMARPIFVRLASVPNAVFANVAYYDFPTMLGPAEEPPTANNTTGIHAHWCQEKLIERNTDPATLAGNYGLGWELIDTSGAGFGIDFIHIVCSVRQLNDQQQVGYADTRK